MSIYDYYDDKETQKKMGLIGGMILFVFVLVLTLTFLILKLTSVIAFGWLWVFAPIWIPMGLGIIMNILGIKPPGQ